MSDIRSETHDRIERRLDQARSLADQAIQRLSRIQHNSLLNRQRLQDAQDRIDQLVVSLKSPIYPLAGSTDQTKQAESVTAKKQPQSLEQLQQQTQQRSELLRQSAHDLKGNFGIISGAVFLLNLDQPEPERQQMLSMLQRNLLQATQLLNQLLDVTRLEAGEERRQLTTFDVAHLLGSLADTVGPMAHEKNLWVRKQGVSSLLIEGDWVKLYRIVQNLLLNAIKYTHVGGVTLGWETAVSGQEWLLTITDTGPGLSSVSQQASGEGVGLLIVRHLCALLEGRLTIEEPTGGGTQFRMHFPMSYPYSF